MTQLTKALLLAAALALPALPAAADTSLTAYEAARAALLAIWAELPLTIRNVTLTEGVPEGYGNYSVHAGNTYRAGEVIHVYAEVLGYGWRDNGDGTWSKLLDADLALLDANGTTVASKPRFLSTDVRSRQKVLESDLAFNVTLSAFQPGAYKLQFAVHDRAGGKDTSFDVPVTLVADEQLPASASDDSSDTSSVSQSSSSAPQ
jgi:hypothetical protein